MKFNTKYRCIIGIICACSLIIGLSICIPKIKPIEAENNKNLSKINIIENNEVQSSNYQIYIDETEKIETTDLEEQKGTLTNFEKKILSEYRKQKKELEIPLTEETENNIIDNSTVKTSQKSKEEINTTTEKTEVIYSKETLNFDTTGWANIDVVITAYCPCSKCNGNYVGQPTASGTPLVVGRTIAVDPKVIPLGSYVVIDGHTYVAEDTGSGIKGARIDLLFATHEEALEWGRQNRTVKVSNTKEDFNEYLNNLNNPSNETETEEIISNFEDISANETSTEEQNNDTEVISNQTLSEEELTNTETSEEPAPTSYQDNQH